MWEGGSQRWPEVDGVPYLRVGREELTGRVVEQLEAGDVATARAELLRDQDDFARQPPPSLETTLAISREEPATFREAMRLLEYGPVAHYFAHRTSTPTFLSGCTLLSETVGGDRILEVCCGAGHFLRWLDQRSETAAFYSRSEGADEAAIEADRLHTTGVDVVWSKLWLAKRYLEVSSDLVCCDVSAASLPFEDRAFDVGFCHDAIYFLPDKASFLGELRRVAINLMIGHAHNRLADHGDVAGTPCSPQEYEQLASGSKFYDDAVLTRIAWRQGGFESAGYVESVDSLEDVEAVGWMDLNDAEHTFVFGDSWRTTLGSFRLNPLLTERDGQLIPDWPEQRFAEEYADADYLTVPVPSDADAALIESRAYLETNDDDATRERAEELLARRTFIDVPERW